LDLHTPHLWIGIGQHFKLTASQEKLRHG